MFKRIMKFIFRRLLFSRLVLMALALFVGAEVTARYYLGAYDPEYEYQMTLMFAKKSFYAGCMEAHREYCEKHACEVVAFKCLDKSDEFYQALLSIGEQVDQQKQQQQEQQDE